ncbi:helicase [Coprobacillus sp. CAG:605]|nr:helicase [Coprobacillus sp. CAG:605]
MDEALQYIDAKIADINEMINKIILDNIDNRDYMAKNILSNLRYLVEYCFFRVYITDKEKKYVKYSHENNQQSIKYVKSCANMRELRALHGFLQISTSHSLPNGDGSSRVLIKYLSYLIELKEFMYKKYKITILDNLYSFPLNVEKNMENYYRQISNQIKITNFNNSKKVLGNMYYVRKIKPIIIDNNLFYEVTLSEATDYINKFNRIVVYSKEKILDNYAIKISSIDRTIQLFEKNVNIKIIDSYKIAIRPCELNNLFKNIWLTI